ncbi:MAG: tetratricopeptide repeat protein [Sideroxydans sp.]|nr:tetratricopeptide repeat protein [Sideroxydans sp.]
MNMFNRFCQYAALCGGALLLCCSLSARADEVQDANKLFKQGQYDQAMAKVDSFLAGKPKDAQARFLKGLILTEQGKTGDAIHIFTSLTEDYPELPEPYNNLAVLYAGQGQYDKARVALEMAIRTHPSYATAHENLGDIYAKMASQAYDRALQLDRSNTSTKTKLALIKELFSSDHSRAGTHNVATGTVNVAKPQPAAETPAAPVVTPVAVAAAPVVEPVPAKPVAAPAPAPAKPVAAEPAPAKVAAAKPAATNSADVLKSVHDWAAAWSAKNVKKYLSFYAPDFDTPGNESRSAWEAVRHDRLSKPKYIHVKISDASVKFTDDTHATVTFRQEYRASHLSSSASKTLLMVKSGGKWLILKEHAKD